MNTPSRNCILVLCICKQIEKAIDVEIQSDGEEFSKKSPSSFELYDIEGKEKYNALHIKTKLIRDLPLNSKYVF